MAQWSLAPICAGLLVLMFPVHTTLAQQSRASAAKRQNAARNEALIDQAKKLLQSGDPQGAMSVLEQAELNGPSASDVHALKGTCLAILQQPIDSAHEFDEALALRPKFAPIYYSSALAYASFGNLDGALDRFATALKLDPSLPGARYNYALALARAGRYADSEKEVDLELASKTRRVESEPDLWRLKARDTYYQKKWAETIVAYRKTLEFDPDWPEAYGVLGEALFSLNRADESRTMLEKSESTDPDNAITHALLARLYLDAGAEAKAIPEFEAAVRLRPNDQDTVYRLYRVYSRNGDKADAARVLGQLKALLAAQGEESKASLKASALNDSGIELEKAGDLPKALEAFDQAAKIDVTNLIFQRNAALILCKLGRAQEAIRRLLDILSADPDDAESLQILAVAKEIVAKGPAADKTLPQEKRAPPE